MVLRHLSRLELSQIADEILGDLLPGAAPQSHLVESITQRYRVGSRMVLPEGDGRVFHYCQAGAPILKTCWGVGPRAILIEGNTAVAALVGARTLTIVNATATLNEYADGWVMPFQPGATMEVMYRILSNTATAGGNVVLTLKDPLLYACTLPTFCSIWPNMYRNVGPLDLVGDGLQAVTVMPPIVVTTQRFFWGQTWGMCFAVPSPPFGSAAGERDLVFNSDGAVRLRLADVGGSQQHAGFLLPHTTTGNDQGFMLQIAP